MQAVSTPLHSTSSHRPRSLPASSSTAAGRQTEAKSKYRHHYYSQQQQIIKAQPATRARCIQLFVFSHAVLPSPVLDAQFRLKIIRLDTAKQAQPEATPALQYCCTTEDRRGWSYGRTAASTESANFRRLADDSAESLVSSLEQQPTPSDGACVCCVRLSFAGSNRKSRRRITSWRLLSSGRHAPKRARRFIGGVPERRTWLSCMKLT